MFTVTLKNKIKQRFLRLKFEYFLSKGGDLANGIKYQVSYTEEDSHTLRSTF